MERTLKWKSEEQYRILMFVEGWRRESRRARNFAQGVAFPRTRVSRGIDGVELAPCFARNRMYRGWARRGLCVRADLRLGLSSSEAAGAASGPKEVHSCNQSRFRQRAVCPAHSRLKLAFLAGLQ